MKIAISIVVLMACLSAVPALAQQNGCPASYWTLLLTAPAHERYFVSFKVSYQGQERTACTTVDAFQDFFTNQSAHQIEESWYLYKNYAIPSKVPFDSLYFNWSKRDAKIEQVAQQGEKYFIAYYFNKYGCLQYEKGVNNADVMQYLQRWCIVAHESSYTGCLVIDSKVVSIR